jgi:hypothetical protein
MTCVPEQLDRPSRAQAPGDESNKGELKERSFIEICSNSHFGKRKGYCQGGESTRIAQRSPGTAFCNDGRKGTKLKFDLN